MSRRPGVLTGCVLHVRPASCIVPRATQQALPPGHADTAYDYEGLCYYSTLRAAHTGISRVSDRERGNRGHWGASSRKQDIEQETLPRVSKKSKVQFQVPDPKSKFASPRQIPVQAAPRVDPHSLSHPLARNSPHSFRRKPFTWSTALRSLVIIVIVIIILLLLFLIITIITIATPTVIHHRLAPSTRPVPPRKQVETSNPPPPTRRRQTPASTA